MTSAVPKCHLPGAMQIWQNYIWNEMRRLFVPFIVQFYFIILFIKYTKQFTFNGTPADVTILNLNEQCNSLIFLPVNIF